MIVNRDRIAHSRMIHRHAAGQIARADGEAADTSATTPRLPELRALEGAEATALGTAPSAA